jgi:diguanylate cyclase (GGDEF)-like protein
VGSNGELSRFRRNLVGVLLIVTVVLTGASVSYGCFVAVSRGEVRHAGEVMDRYAEEVRSATTDRVARYSDTLTDLAWAVGAESDLSNADFDHMTSGLNPTRLPGASAVAFVAPANTDEIAATQARWRLRGHPGLKLVRNSSATPHAFVIFETAFDDGPDMRGVDVTQSAPMASALTTARQSGVLAISSPYQQLRDQGVTESQRQTSILLAAPVYARLGSTFAPKVFHGWIIMGVRGDDFLNQTLGNISQGATQASLHDSGTTIAAAAPGVRLPNTALRRDLTLTAGQRVWHLTVVPTTQLLSNTDRRMSTWALAMGLTLTLMLAALTGVLAGSRNRALAQVDRATTALRDDLAQRRLIEAQLRAREQELQHMAFHDPLTGLANRLLFYERVGHAFSTHVDGDRTFAVLFIDLDGFKQVNDVLGHSAGDAVLRETAGRLSALLRDGDTVARFGGDEFAVLLERLSDFEEAHRVAERMVAQLQDPIAIANSQATVSASVGIAVHRAGADASGLLRDADAAMYAAKAGGKSRYVDSTDLVSQ